MDRTAAFNKLEEGLTELFEKVIEIFPYISNQNLDGKKIMK